MLFDYTSIHMNERTPEHSRRARLIDVLAAEATALVLNWGHTPAGAINAAMNTYKGDVLDQRRAIFAFVEKEVKKRILAEQVQEEKRKHIAAEQERRALLPSAILHEQQLLRGFDGEDTPCEPSSML